MRRIFYVASFLATVILFVSCQKEVSVDSSAGGNGGNGGNNGGGGAGTATLKGNWKFISQEAALKSTVQYDLFGTAIKSITTTNYTTLDNKGDIIFDNSKMTLTGLTYRVNTTSYVEFYEDNNLSDTLINPFVYTMPEYISAADYQLAGSDSIYFTNTSFSFVQGSSMPSGPSRMKYVIEGNKLKLFSNYKESKTETQQGITAQVLHEVKMIINCEKK